MRKIFTSAVLLVTSVATGVHAAPPVIGGGFGIQQRLAPPAQQQTGWRMPSMPRLFGGKKTAPGPQMPQHSFVGQVPQPNAAQRFGQSFRQAVTQNPLKRFSNSSQAPHSNPSDTLALDRPTGPATGELAVMLAKAAEQKGDLAGAREHLQKALAATPGDVNVLRHYGRLEDRQGRLADAEKLYQQAVASNPGHAAAMNDLALCYARQNKLSESASVLEQAIALRQDKPLYRNNIAKVLIELGEVERAKSHLITAHGPAAGNFNLGQLLAAGGKTRQATIALQQSIASDPNFAPAQAALAKIQPAAPQTASPMVAQGTVSQPAPQQPVPQQPVPQQPAQQPMVQQQAPLRPHVAVRNSLPSLPYAAPAPPDRSVLTGRGVAPPSVEPRLPVLAVPSSEAGPSFPRLLPPVMN